MIAKTLDEMTRAVEYGAGIRGQIGAGATFRHPTTDINAEINSSYGEFRELLVEREFDFFLVESAQANLPSGRADTNENYSVVPWPLEAQLIRRVDVFKNNEWSSLEELDWAQLRLPISACGTVGGSNSSVRPLYFAPKSFATVSVATPAAGEIAIAPFATGGKYKLSYLPQWIEISVGTSKFIFPTETGFRWTIWNAIMKILIRDEDPGGRFEKCERGLAMAAERIGRFSARTISTGGKTMRRSRSYW